MFKNIKKKFKAFMTSKNGFSLVELIVVIAIMAVMAAVLAPALLGYVERSRSQKDSSALSEVVNSVQLSLADQDVYDEMLKYSAEQYSCYVDSESPDDVNKVDIKAGKYYMYNDNERQLDETVYKLDGVMRGVTITFAPDAAASNSATLDLIKGHVNKYLPSGKKTYGGLTGAAASPKLADIPESELYNSLRATIGDKINISSQTYRNSEYTIFISMGTTGGKEAAAQDAIKVWGQFSGTNLPEGSSVAGNTVTGSNEFKEPTNNNVNNSSNQEIAQSGFIVPEGAEYIRYEFDGYSLRYKETSRYAVGETVPNLTNPNDEPNGMKNYDVFNYNEYSYQGNLDGWEVSLRDGFEGRQTYGEILTTINGANVVSMPETFKNQVALTIAPTIPSTVTKMNSTFYGCSSLTSAPVIPDSVKEIPYAFINCTSLTTAPTIPQNVYWMENTFDGCSNLSGTIVVHTTNPSLYGRFLRGTQITDVTGNCSDDIKSALLATK